MVALNPVLELDHQPGLAQSRIARHRDERQTALVACGIAGLGQPGQFGFAADHGRGDTFDATTHRPKAARCGRQNQVAAHGLGKALHSNRRLVG